MNKNILVQELTELCGMAKTRLDRAGVGTAASSETFDIFKKVKRVLKLAKQLSDDQSQEPEPEVKIIDGWRFDGNKYERYTISGKWAVLSLEDDRPGYPCVAVYFNRVWIENRSTLEEAKHLAMLFAKSDGGWAS